MKITPIIAIIAVIALMLFGCGQSAINKNDISSDFDKELQEQKIVFIMWVVSFDEPYSKGYFVDGKGAKHIFENYGERPFNSVEDEYAYLLEHYDEFETAEFFDNATLKQCAECLYKVNANAEMIADGQEIMDAPEVMLYGVKIVEEREEFVLLGSESGATKRLDDISSNEIFALFGDKWSLIK